jgi:RHS repeat-associated protein
MHQTLYINDSQYFLKETHYIPGLGIDRIEIMRKGGEDYYFVRDHLGSVRLALDSNCDIVEQYEYSTYGDLTIKNASSQTISTTAIGNRHTYTGREWDENLELYYYRARWYDPKMRRFTQKDIINFTNRYIYVMNNPMNFVDPSGNYFEPQFEQSLDKYDIVMDSIDFIHRNIDIFPKDFQSYWNKYYYSYSPYPIKIGYEGLIGPNISGSAFPPYFDYIRLRPDRVETCDRFKQSFIHELFHKVGPLKYTHKSFHDTSQFDNILEQLFQRDRSERESNKIWEEFHKWYIEKQKSQLEFEEQVRLLNKLWGK